MKTAMQEFIQYLEKDYYINELTNFDKDKIQFLEKEKAQFVDFLEWIEVADIKYQLNNKKIVEQYYTDPIKKS